MSFGSKSLPAPHLKQLARWNLARQRGCVVSECRPDPCKGALEQHHLKSGNLRMGHWWTVCLCQGHHAQAAKLAKEHGNEQLMMLQDARLGYVTPRIRERRRRNGSPTARPRKSFRSATDAQPLSDDATRSQNGTMHKRKRKSRCAAAANQVKRPAGGFA